MDIMDAAPKIPAPIMPAMTNRISMPRTAESNAPIKNKTQKWPPVAKNRMIITNQRMLYKGPKSLRMGLR